MAKRLMHQVIAIEKGVKARCYAVLTELYKLVQKPVLFAGQSRTYVAKDTDGETYPDEAVKVQFTVADVLLSFVDHEVAATDMEAEKDYGNCLASADVVVNGKVLIAQAPTTFLLHLEKRLTDFRAFVSSLPTLDEAQEWTKDANAALYRSAVLRSHRTAKVQKALVLLAPTDKHPGQAQLITEDVTVGHWSLQHSSGAMPVPDKKKMLRRVDDVLDAVKEAREQANSIEVEAKKVTGALFAYITG